MKNKDVIVAVGGCMTQQDGASKKLHECFPFVDIIFGTHNMGDFIRLLTQKKKQKKSVIEIVDKGEDREDISMHRTSYPNGWVNIIYGCNNFCTYCIVPYVKGRERSRKSEDIIKEVKELVENGYKEITLLGQNVNSYGNDLGEENAFPKLLQDICEQVKGKYRLRFMSNHPKDLSPALIEVMAKYKNICNSIHLPLQSGSNRILKLMNRRYTREQYMEKVDAIRKVIPDIAISTDVMVGFPTETEEDFNDTMQLMERVNFASAFMFVYSRRSGTPADKMDGQIDESVSKSRITAMVAAQNARTASISKTYEGKTIEILCEDYDQKKGMYLGRDEYGRMGYFESDTNLIGEFVNIKVDREVGISLYGQIVK